VHSHNRYAPVIPHAVEAEPHRFPNDLQIPHIGQPSANVQAWDFHKLKLSRSIASLVDVKVGDIRLTSARIGTMFHGIAPAIRNLAIIAHNSAQLYINRTSE